MGNGVYLKEGNTIPTGTILGLYLGEIMPYDDEAVRGSRYVYQLFSKDRPHRWNDVAIDAAVHGNWTRFVNSHCEPNVRATVEMVGGVLFVTFTAARELEGGGQLFVSYGPGYFWGENGEGTCECGWKEGKHLPPSFNGSE
ncbi:hypothetical protein QBC34DRAFT_411438 [Podospora aff. communis PSN243]|uniref:SET domain-containing protein n=1 Tax=Podospora aff. communis PSN243 TaxID=3040156 RepID=A0AAV9GDP8_9PEZI|nr:hypothetical protein QBC34DRAFT_411438 [Podospora aff. communis PSN243]